MRSGGALDAVMGILDPFPRDRGDGEAQFGTSCRTDDASRLIEEREAERLEREEAVEEGALAGSRAGCGAEAELEAADQVVGEDRELLPEFIGLTIARRDRIEGEVLLELAECLLVTAAASHEVPERSDAEFQVGGDGGVLEVAVVGIEEIKLEILGGLVKDTLAIHDDALGPLPLRDRERQREAADRPIDPRPLLLARDLLAHPEPFPQRHLDRIAERFSVEKAQDLGIEEGAVEADFETMAVAEAGAQVCQNRTQEAVGVVRVVDVARAIPAPQQMAGLREVGGERVVRAILRVMRVEAALGAFGRSANAEHRAIHVERQAREAERIDGIVRHVAHHRGHGLDHGLRGARHPARHRAIGRQPVNPREAQEDRIVRKHGEMREPASAREQQPDDQQHHARRAVVPDIAKRLAQSSRQIDRNEIASEQLESAVRRDRFLGEADRKIVVDARSNPVSTQPHKSGSSVRAMKRGNSISHTVGATFNSILRSGVRMSDQG